MLEYMKFSKWRIEKRILTKKERRLKIIKVMNEEGHHYQPYRNKEIRVNMCCM